MHETTLYDTATDSAGIAINGIDVQSVITLHSDGTVREVGRNSQGATWDRDALEFPLNIVALRNLREAADDGEPVAAEALRTYRANGWNPDAA